MNRMTAITLLAALICWTPHAMAYIDPGSGSAIMSAVIGVFVATYMMLKTYWFKIKAFFTSTEKKQESDTTANPESDQ
jgi:uncharacterized membrane protein YedE/YeeE